MDRDKSDDYRMSNEQVDVESQALDPVEQQIKRDNRKALKVFIPMVIVAMIIGGIIGGMSATDQATDVVMKIGLAIREVAYTVAPFGVVICAILGVGLTLYFYKMAKRDLAKVNIATGLADGHPREQDLGLDEELVEKTVEEADRKLSIAIIIASVETVVTFMFFAIVLAYIENYVDQWELGLFLSIGFLLVGDFGAILMQQRCVDLDRKLNPEKQGSIYDKKFHDRWEESCDEMEKLMIYKSSYRAFQAMNKTCSIMFTGLLLLSIFFKWGPMPALAVGVVWLVGVVTYSRESMKVTREKINQ